ncbi:enoyl-CoA hydratase-related protein [Gammaproteobacteria bacterium]|nr:enoyl-CoA hydratase-related protein [Gammaproteobacteria bacterium]
MSNSLTYEVDGPIATLTLNRPDKLNAINSDMIEAINLAMDDAEDNYNVRAIILQAEGRAFSAGFDLDDEVWDSKEESNIRQALESDFNMVMRFWDSPKPTIAAVQGYCLGGAMEMALACDITVASDDALFGEPEVSIASGVVALILPWLTGPKLAKELLLTADIKISSQRIYEMGLINRITAPENLRDEALTMAETIAANDRLSVEITKKAINRTMEIAGMREALLDGLEADILLETSQSDEAKQFNEILDKEGLKAALAWRRSTVLKK